MRWTIKFSDMPWQVWLTGGSGLLIAVITVGWMMLMGLTTVAQYAAPNFDGRQALTDAHGAPSGQPDGSQQCLHAAAVAPLEASGSHGLQCQDTLVNGVRAVLTANGYSSIQVDAGSTAGMIALTGDIRDDAHWAQMAHILSQIPGLEGWTIHQISPPVLPSASVRVTSLRAEPTQSQSTHNVLLQGLAQQYGVPSAVIHAVMHIESNGQQQAANGKILTSTQGALGVMQLMPETARELDVDPRDRAQNIEGGVHYLATLSTHYQNDWSKVLAAYNWGIGHVDRAIAQHGTAWQQALPSETQHYLARFNSVLAQANERQIRD